MKRLLVVTVLLVAGCIGHVFALPFFVAGSVADALCKRKLPKGAQDPSDAGWLYICRDAHDGGSEYRLFVFPSPYGGEIDIPGEETYENAKCGVEPERFGGPNCVYKCSWPEGPDYDVYAGGYVPCLDAGTP